MKNIMLSKFIKKLNNESSSTKVKSLTKELNLILEEEGDMLINIDYMCQMFGIKF